MVLRGNSIDRTITMNRDFLLDSLNFIKTNFDSIILMTIIIFLMIGWTWVFDWKMPKKKNVLLKKNIAIEVSEWVHKGETGHLVDKYGNKLDKMGRRIGSVFEGLQNINEKLEKERTMDCGDDLLCKQNKECLETIDCKSNKSCCEVKTIENELKCIAGNKKGPLYHADNFDEWWYLGNHYKKN